MFRTHTPNWLRSWLKANVATGSFLAAGGFLLATIGILLSKFRIANFALTSLYLRYQEIGFVKRGLLGTLLAPILPELIDPGEARLAVIAIWMTAIAIACLLLGMLYKNQPPLLTAACILSPAVFMQMGYTLGFLDIFCLLSLLCTAYVVTRFRPNLVSLALVLGLGIAGPFFHELYLLAFFPTALTIATKSSRRFAIAIIVAGILAASFIAAYGSYEEGIKGLQAAVNAHFAPTIEVSTFELTSSLKTNASGTIAHKFLGGVIARSIPGFCYLLLLTTSFSRSSGGARSINLCRLAALSPLVLTFLGGDTSRWIGMACMNLFVLGIMGYITFELQGKLRRPFVFTFTLLGPIGIGASFPIVYWKIAQLAN